LQQEEIRWYGNRKEDNGEEDGEEEKLFGLFG